MSDHTPVKAARDAARLIRPDVLAMAPYTPILPFEVLSEQLGRPPEQIVKLDANENPYGPSRKALEALASMDSTAHIYPDPEARHLRARLAEYVGVSMEHILAGSGADELIDLTTRLFLDRGDVVINCPPTFGMYPFDAALAGGRVVNVPRRADFSLDVDAIEQAALESGAKLLFLTTPNNPDGGLLDPEILDRLLRLPLAVVVDEAYIEFSGAESFASRVPDEPNLIVLRTFSKWAGLAGLRIGYGLFPLPLIEQLWKIKQPYNVNAAADLAARAALNDLPSLQLDIERIRAERDRLFAALSAFPQLSPYPSRANFVLVRVEGFDAAALKQRLAQDHGILVRHFDKPGLADHVRISAGTPAQTDALLGALRTIFEEKTP
jgi:histidinol-phosphate aminotransferase